MAKYQTKVKCYQRKKSKQYLITLTGNHGFKNDEPVIILSNTDFKEIENISNSRKNQILDLESQLSQLERNKDHELTVLNNQLTTSKTKVENLENEVKEFKENNVEFNAKVKTLEQELSTATVRIKELEFMEDQVSNYKNLQDEHNRLRNKHDHLQERLRTALEEINKQQKVISDLSNRGFFDYITGRLPESYKQLEAPKK